MTPVEVLAAHRERRVLVSGFMESRCEGDDCGWRGPVDDWPAHVLDALTQADMAVVELPAKDGDGWIGGRVRAEDDTVELSVGGMAHLEYQTHVARRLGAALLAAAAAAETGGKA